jgi:hypothetical protein
MQELSELEKLHSKIMADKIQPKLIELAKLLERYYNYSYLLPKIGYELNYSFAHNSTWELKVYSSQEVLFGFMRLQTYPLTIVDKIETIDFRVYFSPKHYEKLYTQADNIAEKFKVLILEEIHNWDRYIEEDL